MDKVRLQRVVNVMQQFIGFPAFDIGSMLMPGTTSGRPTVTAGEA